MSTIERETERQAEPVGPGAAGTLMSPAEFDAVEDWDEAFVYELIHGVLIVNPSPAEAERGPNELLGVLLYLYNLNEHDRSTLDATLPEQHVRGTLNRRRADRVIWAGLGRTPDPARDVPTIVVEFVSRGKRDRTRDYIEKRAEYLELGVREYWVVDRFRRLMTVYRADGSERVVAADGTYETSLLPGFLLPLAPLLAAADRWRADPPAESE